MPDVAASAPDGAPAEAGNVDAAAGSTSDGGPAPEAGDVLSLMPSQVAPGLVQCFASTLLHNDGTSTAIGVSSGGLAMQLADQTIAMPAQAGDCYGDELGIIGLVPGGTMFAVTYSAGGSSVSASSTVQVLPVMVEIVPATTIPAKVGVGGDAQMPDLTFHAYDASHSEVYPNDTIPMSLLSVQVVDGTLATVSRRTVKGQASFLVPRCRAWADDRSP